MGGAVCGLFQGRRKKKGERKKSQKILLAYHSEIYTFMKYTFTEPLPFPLLGVVLAARDGGESKRGL